MLQFLHTLLSMKVLQVREIPDEDYRALRIAAAENDMSVSEFIRRIIADLLAERVRGGAANAAR
jgi:plasmid stability protein